MSASSQGIKFKFGGFFKQLFNKSSQGNGAAQPEAATEAEAGMTHDPVQQHYPMANHQMMPPAPMQRAQHAPHVPQIQHAPRAVVSGVTIPLQAVVASFPLELRPKIRHHETGDATITIPFEKVLPQLSSGMVRISFGEIRRSAAQLFAPGVESDGVPVALPLSEILSRINPAMLVRRTSQKHVIVPEEIASPFAGDTFSVGNTNQAPIEVPQPAGHAPVASVPGARPANVSTRGNTEIYHHRPAAPSMPAMEPVFARKPAMPTPPAAPAMPPMAAPAPDAPIFQRKPMAAPGSGGTTTFQRKSMTPSGPTSVPANEPIFQRKPAPPAPPVTPPPALPLPDQGAEMPIFQRKPMAPTAPITPIAPAPAAPIVPSAPIAFKMPAGDELTFVRKSPEAPAEVPASPLAPQTPMPSAPPRPKDFLAAPPVSRTAPPPAPPTPAAPTNNAEAEVLLVPLTAVAESWPEALREELVKNKLVDARLAMPVDLVEASLKRGRVAFPWKTVRSWIRPPAPNHASPHDATEVELPLSVIAPLFVARQSKNSDRANRPAMVDETIPNLFFGLPKPEAATTPKPADTNFYTYSDTNDAARVDDTEFKRKAGGTDFVSRHATPNEVVSRAAALDGVAGALIALPDGLMVASRIPQEFNGDTLAAFLPQIFSKVSQATKELRLGDLNNLNFTVGNVPWKIFRVNAIFFAVFGRAGEQMPSVELAALAAELDRRR